MGVPNTDKGVAGKWPGGGEGETTINLEGNQMGTIENQPNALPLPKASNVVG